MNTNKDIKFEIEAPNGTIIDLYSHINTVIAPFDANTKTDELIIDSFCSNCFREYPKSKIMKYLFIKFHKCRSVIMEVRQPYKTKEYKGNDW